MIIEKIVTNVNQLAANEIKKRHMEYVYLNSSDLLKKVQRVVTDHGKEIGIRLNENKSLENGDVLLMNDHELIVISVLPDDLLVIKPNTMTQMGDIAHKIGNRHLPAQFLENKMLVQYDHLVEQLLKEMGVNYTRENITVKQAFRNVGHSHV